ncbi:lysine--tRNA ligase, partial [Patescibacteria group bacterium]|nr:lysine--tRNA ligase [Patescibacteria group bacterium]
MSRFEEEYNIRLKKLNKAQKKGINPYPARVNRSHEIKNVLHDFKALVKTNIEISIVGRTKSIRLHGGSCFANIVDGTEQIQIFVKKDKIGQENYNNFKELVDIGDFIQIKGTAFKTKKGESTILVDDFRLISKSLMPLPEKWHGLSDVEIRYRKRYLDLISNDQVKNIFKKRALIIKNIRDFLDANNFLEVETPVLQSIPGGANAKPFVTHHNALNINLFLRIAPELYLKQLITGGFEKVYEIARCFRNEGIDKNHNPEFTQVEFYAAYW